ncbi:MAG: flagellar protein FlaG [Pseudomonadales bacterium]|nr:flagellar protein FlaG [Pseudomonadales bacterium]
MDSNVIGSSNRQTPAAAHTVLAADQKVDRSGTMLPLPGEESTAENLTVPSIEKSEKPEFDISSLEDKMQLLNQQLQERQRDLSFDIDKSSNQPVLKVIHSETGEVIRQIPTELALKIASNLEDGLTELIDTLA